MNNTVLEALKEMDNYKLTENGGIALKSTNSAVLDMFALCGAYRNHSNEDCIFMFKNAFEENADLALKCLFYLADCRGGQGERRFFRVCFNWLCRNYPEIAKKNVKYIPTFRRWDDVLYSCLGTTVMKDALALIKSQLVLDIQSETPSLMAKWLPSINASSREARMVAKIVKDYLGMSNKEYRRTLSTLRSRIKIVEKLMSENRWDEIDFSKLPSRAGLIYKDVFIRRDETSERYTAFANDKNTKVNANVLYPYEIVAETLNKCGGYWHEILNMSETDRVMLEKYWNNLPDYFNGKQSNMLCVVDTSGSMTGETASAPINVAISLGMYAAEKAGGPFKDHYISFSSRPQLIKIAGVDFVDKVHRIYKTNLIDNTDLTRTFDMLLDVADRFDVREEDIPETIVVISDMEIDNMSCPHRWTKNNAITEMDKVRAKWADHGHKMPKLVYWNVNARQNTILDNGPGVSFVSGMSPTIFTSIITGKTGFELMLETLLSDRYKDIIA